MGKLNEVADYTVIGGQRAWRFALNLTGDQVILGESKKLILGRQEVYAR